MVVFVSFSPAVLAIRLHGDMFSSLDATDLRVK